jgi:single-strand DNA-binding protein
LAWQNNTAEICGLTGGVPELSHISRNVEYYTLPVITERLSGAVDRVNIIASSALIKNLPREVQRVSVKGELRSFNNRSGSGNRLLLYIYAHELTDGSGCTEDINYVSITGTICKEPTWRRTPMGREICDLMLAVNRRYGRSDYLPCIAWGKNAELAGSWQQGKLISLTGRFQSRKYIKIEDGVGVEKTAYEVSVTEFIEPVKAAD